MAERETMGLTKVLIREAETYGCSATVRDIGLARLEVYTVQLGTRVKSSPCGVSDTVTDESEHVHVVNLLGHVRVVREIDENATFKSERQAYRDGARWSVAVNKDEKAVFKTPYCNETIQLCQEYRD